MADQPEHPHIVNIPEDDLFNRAMQEGNWNSFDDLLVPRQREVRKEINNNWCTLFCRPLFELYPRQRRMGENGVTFLQEANWNSFVSLLELHDDRANGRFNEDGHTFLHAAIVAGLDKLAKELVECMSEEDLALKVEGGHTALVTAIEEGKDEIVVLMVRKNVNLVTMRDENGLLPVALAARGGNKETARYLFLKTQRITGALDLQTPQDITALLIDAIISDMYDVSIGLLNLYPDSVFIADIDRRRVLSVLAKRPPAYSSDKSTEGQVKAREILKIVCRRVARLGRAELAEQGQGVYDAVIDASKFGNVEFVTGILNCNRHLQYATGDEIKRDIFRNAITYRQENVYILMHKMKNKSVLLKPGIDGNGNNVLHNAGLFTKGYTSKNICGVFLQIQRAVQWFQEVEKCVPPRFKDDLNYNGRTPRDLFEEEHHDLVKEGEKSMKEIAQTCMIVTILIATVMLTTIFAILVAVESSSREPTYLHARYFVFFTVNNVLSLVCSVCSLIIFLSILTTRYTSQDFLSTLPRKLMLGLLTLFVSLVTMMMTFFGGASLLFHFESRDLVVVTLIVLSFLPAALFIFKMFPLVIELFKSTYGPSIFCKSPKLRVYSQ